MRILKKRTVRQAMSKAINIIIVSAMMLSLVPSASLLAAPAYQTPETDGNCVQAQSESTSSLFLPIANRAQSLLTSATSVISSPQAAPRTITWEVGKTYTYDYNVELNNTAFQRTVEGTAESTSSSKTVVDAEAVVSITSIKDDGTFVGQVVLNKPFICSVDSSAADGTDESVVDDADLAAELQKPLIFEQAPNGTITAIQLPAESRVVTTNIQKGVINSLQMTLQADSDSYMATEVGGQGTYTATYTLAEDGDNLNITKSYGTGSFSEMRRDGDDDNGSMTMNTSFSAKLDGAKGILTSVTGSEVIETGDGVEEPDGSDAGFDGATAWTKIASETALTFVSSNASSALQSAALSAPYVDGGLGAEFPDEAAEALIEIDLDDVDLDAEIAKLVADPTNPEPFLDVLDLVAVDEGTAVLDVVKAALDANSSNVDAAGALIDVLTAVGTPYAQDILAGMVDASLQVGAASLSSAASVTVTEKALINLVLVDSPTMTTVTAIKNVSTVEGDLQGTAVSVLGATADKLSDSDPDMAESLTTDLLASLNTANSEEDVALYLGALGNAAQESTADEITEYLGASLTLDDGTVLTETIGIQYSAYVALAQIPGETAEGALVAALNDEDELLGTRITILDMLADRDDLSAAGLAALSANASLADFLSDDATEEPLLSAASVNAPELSVSKSWNKTFGGSKLGVAFPGVFTAKTPPHYNGLYLYTQQKVDGKVINKTINLVNGNLKLWRNTNTTYKLQAKLGLLNYQINKAYNTQFSCAWNTGVRKIWSGSTSRSFSYRVPVISVITVGVSVKLSAYGRLDYSTRGNVCNPANMSARGQIIPSGRVTARASADVSVVLLRGGVGVDATIMDSRFDLKLDVTHINNSPKACANVSVRTQAIRGTYYIFLDKKQLSKWEWKWKRQWTRTLGNFSSPTRTYSLYARCWQ